MFFNSVEDNAMITMIIIVYVIVSLCMAMKTYEQRHLETHSRYADPFVKNKNYLDAKKSLVYGFLFLPKQILICVVFVGVAGGAMLLFITVFTWIITNMP